MLAKALATIDHVSNGRLEVGMGAGWHEQEYRDYGIPFSSIAVRQDQLEEAAQIVRSMLSQDCTSLEGKYFQVRNARCNPKPVQKHVPLWIGGAGEKRTLRTAARYGDGWNMAYIGPEVFRRKNEVLSQWCERQGRDPATLVRSVNLGFYLKVGERQAAAERQRFMAQWGPAAALFEPGMLFGTPRQVVERIGDYFDAGAYRVNIALRAPLDLEAVQSYAEEVLPAFK